jgi:hypothetical protein
MTVGSCLCGDVAYEVAGKFVEAHHCHCGFCRKEHGTPYASYGMAASNGFRWLRGEGAIQRYESSPGFQRAFCGRCGSIVPGPGVPGLVFVPLGNLDGDPGVRPSGHIFVGSKAPWWEIRDGLPEHAGFPPGFDAPVHATRTPQDPPGRPRGSCLCGRVAFVLEESGDRALLLRPLSQGGRPRRQQPGRGVDGLRFTRGEGERASFGAARGVHRSSAGTAARSSLTSTASGVAIVDGQLRRRPRHGSRRPIFVQTARRGRGSRRPAQYAQRPHEV